MIGLNLGVHLALIYSFLHLFGWGFNAIVAHLEAKKYAEGYVSDLVVVGVAVTLVPFVSLAGLYPAWQIIAYVCGGFVASGLPMMIGSRVRHARARAQEQRDVTRPEGLA